MPSLTDHTDYAFVQQHVSWDRAWEFFDGDGTSLNIAHECIDRHAADDAGVAVRLARADGRDEPLTFRHVADWSSRFAHWLQTRGVSAGDRVAIIPERSPIFYAALVGAMKCGPIAVPLFTWFGPDGVGPRVSDCRPKCLLLGKIELDRAEGLAGTEVTVAGEKLRGGVRRAAGGLQGQHEAGRPSIVSTHVGHNAQTSGSREAHRSDDRLADGGRAVRNRHPPGGSILLPVVARLGT